MKQGKNKQKEAAIKRSEENLNAAKLLIAHGNCRNAAASRLYYSVLQLIFAEMCCHTDFKLGANTESHKQARDYMKNKYGRAARNFKNLEELRSQADYEEVPIDEKSFNDACRLWIGELGGLRAQYLNNLNSPHERVIL